MAIESTAAPQTTRHVCQRFVSPQITAPFNSADQQQKGGAIDKESKAE